MASLGFSPGESHLEHLKHKRAKKTYAKFAYIRQTSQALQRASVGPPPQHPAFIPPPLTNYVNLNLPLDIILPGIDDEVSKDGQLVFHTVGDTGGINGTEIQDAIAGAMQAQIDESRNAKKNAQIPRFFYHLGDVVYYNGLSRHYREQFYEPYQYYDAPIVAIPGNHDGDTRTRRGDEPDNEPSLRGFMENFCASRAEFHFKYRETMTQPYVYWTLEAPIVTIIGLYSNVDGYLDAPGTFEQQRWLEGQLKSAPTDRALIIGVHHDPYSLDSAHGGYPGIEQALSRAFKKTNRLPDLVLSGHVHNYQRFTRKEGGHEIPFVIAGAGGYAHTSGAMHRVAKDPNTHQKIQAPFPTARNNITLEAYNDSEPGFLRMTVSKKQILGEYFTVDFDGNPQGRNDAFSIDLGTHRVTTVR